MSKRECTKLEIEKILNNEEYGVLSTLNKDQSIYSIPLNFVYFDNKIYLHGKCSGKKIDNIKNNSDVTFLVYNGKTHKDRLSPCKTGTKYDSVIIDGDATILEDENLKLKVLSLFSMKYTPELSIKDIDESITKNTSIIEIKIIHISSKHHD